ncbi:unnamed protein product [Lactuca virosa]|uniref:Uncharacterized protein n=1 Tax=Lactuca virosa TaxID=75947 RepID=A0AAU9PUZ5_9ASTR|nr:unnamed protein product [Lactuca virosa]
MSSPVKINSVFRAERSSRETGNKCGVGLKPDVVGLPLKDWSLTEHKTTTCYLCMNCAHPLFDLLLQRWFDERLC